MAFSTPSRGSRRRGRTPMAEINVTPMVDVMLVLLVIFMVTAPLMSAGVPVQLPDSRAKPLIATPSPLDLTLTASGAIFLGKAETSLAALPAQLAAVPRGADGKPPQVNLRADKSLDVGRMMAVMGELNRAGFDSIALVTAPGAGGAQGGAAGAAISPRSATTP